MKDLFEFMGEHPILTFFLAGFVAQVLCAPFKMFRPIKCKCFNKESK